MITRSHAKNLSQKPVNQLLLQVPLKNTGLIEDKLFKDDFMMEKNQDIYIEGLPYSYICKDKRKLEYLIKLRNNMPPYCMKTKKQKFHIFNKINKDYRLNCMAQDNNSKVSENKKVSFSNSQNFKVFDKRQTPHKISFSLQKNDPLKQ